MKTIKLEIRNATPEDIADLLEQIAGMIQQGYTSGYPPNGTWHLSDDE